MLDIKGCCTPHFGGSTPYDIWHDVAFFNTGKSIQPESLAVMLALKVLCLPMAGLETQWQNQDRAH